MASRPTGFFECEDVLVRFVVADVDGRIAAQAFPRRLEGDALVRRSDRQDVDDQLAADDADLP